MSSDRFSLGDPGHVAEHNRLARLVDGADLHGGLVEAVAAAATEGRGGIILGPGTYTIDQPIILPSNLSIRGAGKAATALLYSGTGAAIRGSESSRRYNFLLTDLTLSPTEGGQATIGLDLVNVSTSELRGVAVQGFPTGIKMRGTTGGWCVYNEFHGCTVRNGDIGLQIEGAASNEHKVFGGRYYGSTCGIWLRGSNNCTFHSVAVEGAATGIWCDGSGGFQDTAYFASPRLEGCGVGIKVSGANARGNVFAFPHLSGNTTDLDNTGNRTVHLSHLNWPPA